MIPKEESRKDHLPHAKSGPKGREESDWEGAQDVDEKDGQECVHKAQREYGDCKGSDRKGRNYHIGGAPLLIIRLLSGGESAEE